MTHPTPSQMAQVKKAVFSFQESQTQQGANAPPPQVGEVSPLVVFSNEGSIYTVIGSTGYDAKVSFRLLTVVGGVITGIRIRVGDARELGIKKPIPMEVFDCLPEQYWTNAVRSGPVFHRSFDGTFVLPRHLTNTDADLDKVVATGMAKALYESIAKAIPGKYCSLAEFEGIFREALKTELPAPDTAVEIRLGGITGAICKFNANL